MVGVPSSRRHRRGEAHRRSGSAGRSRTRCPTSRTHRATPSGPRSITTPSDSSTSTDPHFDEAARPPCLATRAPAAAVTIAAIVETFTVPARSPPVPHVSTSGPSTSLRSTRSANSSIVRTSAASSPAVSPLARRPTAKRGDLGVGRVAGEDRPPWPAAIRSSGRSSRRSRRPMTSGHSAAIHPPDATGARAAGRGARHRGRAAVAQAAVLRRWRTSRRRSRSSRPPHTPCFSRAVIACSRHGSRTGHTAQIAFAASAARRPTPTAGRRSRGRHPDSGRIGANGCSSVSVLSAPPAREGRWISSNTENFGRSSPVPESSFAVRPPVDSRPRVVRRARKPGNRPVGWGG